MVDYIRNIMIKAIKKNVLLLIILMATFVVTSNVEKNILFFDEKYIINAISSSKNFTMFFFQIIRDSHPPFYYITSYWWTKIFGFSEYIIISLSVIISLLNIPIILLTIKKQKKLFKIFYTWHFLSTWLFFYYAHSARMYALLLLLANLVFYYYLKNNSRIGLFFSTFLCSITHFFGVIWSAIILLLQYKEHRTRSILVNILIVFFYPIIYILFLRKIPGALNADALNLLFTKDEDHFFANFISANFIVLYKLIGLIKLNFFYKFKNEFLFFLINVLFIIGLRKVRDKNYKKSFFIFVIFSLLLAILNIKIAQDYNYIIFIPVISYLLASFFSNLNNKIYIGLFVIYLCLNSLISLSKIDKKWHGASVWKDIANIGVLYDICNHNTCYFKSNKSSYDILLGGIEKSELKASKIDHLNINNMEYILIKNPTHNDIELLTNAKFECALVSQSTFHKLSFYSKERVYLINEYDTKSQLKSKCFN